ncbi:DEAD/DEAH box helicase family protein [Pelagicoccus sp. SDUM812002]|uniref:type I restriction endonuclease subunit R n=1 Tax=Pelagicoccus sp. SDUM812002 TaxID=3041266 RepID=UPI0028101542|nr:DEAD/DEAH box helicase family protein [Pelagicoccus sp. SDUM812002]MDQ8184089.1 DEAD/DEAH box helicase family protein [Pelagicoccus sp. SDUM812002]
MSPSQTNERALESCIEKALTGLSRDELKKDENGELIVSETGAPYGLSPEHGYQLGWPSDFDKEFAIDTRLFWEFLQSTQAEELKKLQDRPNWQRLILERLNRKILKDGILSVLKKGLSIDSARLTLLYSLPYNATNPEVQANFEKNIFSVTRQVHFSQSQPALSIDMAIFINGIAIATIELKNAWTGQTTYHARKQYQEDRDPKEPLLNFKRCLVHFAADTDEVYMTTKLAGKKTFFLPFNKGHNNGKGNPPNPNGHKTSYLWDEVLRKESLTNIIEHFCKLIKEKDPKTDKTRETLFFPRYQQLDVVRKLLQHAGMHGPGQRYLIQHSAGSGKSNSITWAAYQLIELYAEGSDAPVFDSVIVVTDRRALDKQLRDNIKQFSEVKNIVAHATKSQDLKEALESGKKVIITTIQKFPFIVQGIESLSERNFAVIIDEAHSSQSGKAADKMSTALSKDEEDEEEPEDLQDKILKAMEGRKLSENASYFAFTATPKNATLEKFGVQLVDGKFVPFHLYSMKQAIEEEFILDVLANYTTYRSYYEIQKSVEDNPLFDTAKAQKRLRAYVEGHAETIAVKAEIMVNHFMENVWTPKKLKGKAKAMVVTRNIVTAIRYYLAIREALKKRGTPFKAIVAFSGKKKVDGIEHTEESLNGFPSKDIPDEFDSDDYKLLVVANKYLTGFDQPKLHSMYVDKKLQHVLAVQTLSRLNRANKKLGKNDTFILNFYNATEDIKRAFDPFYTSTSLAAATDVNVLHDLKDLLDEEGVYEQSEVIQFNELYFNNVPADQLSPIIDIAAERFNNELELEEDQKVGFKVRAKQFVKIYGQVACMIPFNNPDWEMLHWFLKFLIPKLHITDTGGDQMDEILNSVDLSSYGLSRVKLNSTIGLDSSDTELDPQNPNPRNPGGEEERETLDDIIRSFNERFFAGWEETDESQRVRFVNILRNVVSNPNYEAQVVNNDDVQNRRLAFEKIVQQAVNQQRKNDLELYRKFAGDEDFKQAYISEAMRYLTMASPEDLENLLRAS